MATFFKARRSAISRLRRSSRTRSAIHPVIAAMNTLDYAAATLGNHDFNYGLEALERAYAQARFPVVCCNVRKSDGSPWFPPSIVIERAFVDESGTPRRLKVGVIGVAPPQIAQWDEAHVRGRLTTVDIVEAARAELARAQEPRRSGRCALSLRDFAGSLRLRARRTRVRISPGSTASTRSSSAISTCCFPARILPGFPGVDAERGTIHGKPAVMAGFFGSHLGIIDLELENGQAAGVSPKRGSRPGRSPDATQTAARSRWSSRTLPCSKRPRPRTRQRCATSARPSASSRRRSTPISR